MGFFGKIKNIFYDEEVIEIPEKEEVKAEDKPRIQEVIVPKKESETAKTESTFSERELFKSEPTFKFPVVDEEEEIVPERSKVNVLEVERKENRNIEIPRRENVISNKYEPRREEKPVQKTFTPSPVISPIYGILDKNYKKEEIKENVESIKSRPLKSEINYDSVRRKAYGTLEDELENTLTKMSNDVLESVDELEKDINNMPNKSIEDLLNEIESNANISIGELEEKIKDKEEKEELKHEEEKRTNIDDEVERVTEEINFSRVKDDIGDKTLEHDLFNLIDSMYEDKEGE